MSDAPILIERQGPAGIVTLNRPDKFNCLSRALADGLAGAVRSFSADPACRVLVLKANGKQFCTGADLDEVLAARTTPDGLDDFLSAGHAALAAIEASRLPAVAAVHGLCLAGGLELMMACDIVFAARSARFGDQHAQYGLVPGWGGTQRLPRLVGLRRALQLMYGAEWLDAETARQWGLVNFIADDAALVDECLSYARMLASRNPEGIAAMKSLARNGLDGRLDAGLAREKATVGEALRSANVAEGLDAFQSRRTPRFT